MQERVGQVQLDFLDRVERDPIHTSGLSLHVRESARAKRLILQVCPPGLLEVIVPRGTKPKDVQAFVESNRGWIESKRRSLKLDERATEPTLPESIELAAIGQTISIEYSRGSNRVRSLSNSRLAVRHDDIDRREILNLIRRWLIKCAREVLMPWLLVEAERLEVTPRRVQVRLQRTRWGSCSAQGNISLNAALLLVDPGQVRYLFVHELCHLTHLNHSARFWSRVLRFEPEYQAADRQLASAWAALPAWLFDARHVT
jgi:predicted metal-dependent hydrolase